MLKNTTGAILKIATNPETGETAVKEVKRVFENKTFELLHLTVNGEVITSTPGHKYYAPEKGWTSAIELRAGDLLQLVNGEYVVVEAVQHELLETPVTIYNFEVEDFHTYYVGEQSVLVHNRDCLSDQELIDAANDIHYAQYKNAWWGSKNPITVTQATDGTVVISKNNGVIGPKARQRAAEIFGSDDVIIVRGRGANYNNATNAVSTLAPNHAEARGLQALLSNNIDVAGARQATTLRSCSSCSRLQEALGVINLTGGTP